MMPLITHKDPPTIEDIIGDHPRHIHSKYINGSERIISTSGKISTSTAKCRLQEKKFNRWVEGGPFQGGQGTRNNAKCAFNESF